MKSLVVFEIHTFDKATNLDQLAKKISAMHIPHLTWDINHKKLDVAYGMKKLQMAATIEDQKLTPQMVIKKLKVIEEIQSIELESKQKMEKVSKSLFVNSTVTFEVKVYDNETDLDDLAKRILDMKIEGVQWNAEFKKLESEFGLMKLQMSCVIKSEKISMDDIFQPIEARKEVQTVHLISMKKS